MNLKQKSIEGISKRHTEFHLIKHRELRNKVGKLTENYEEKNGYYVTMTLTFDQRSPILTGFEANVVSNHLENTSSKLVYPSVLFTSRAGQTDRQTNCSENITPPRFRGGVKIPKPRISTMRRHLELFVNQR